MMEVQANTVVVGAEAQFVALFRRTGSSERKLLVKLMSGILSAEVTIPASGVPSLSRSDLVRLADSASWESVHRWFPHVSSAQQDEQPESQTE